MSAETPNPDTSVDDELDALAAAEREPEPEYDADFLDRLTDAERAALTAGDDEAEAGEQPEAEPAPEAEAPAPIEEPAPTPAPAPVAYDTDLAALNAKAKELEAAEKAVWDSYDEAELTADERSAKLSEIRQQQNEVAGKVGAIQSATSAQTAAEDAQWAAACRSFVAANPQFVSPEHREGFDAEITAVTADPRFANLPFQQQLDLASRRYALTPQGASLSAAPAAAPKPAPAKAEPQARQPDKLATKPIPTVADMPAEAADPHLSNVAALAQRIDREPDPEKSERILRGLSEEMRDQVLSYGG